MAGNGKTATIIEAARALVTKSFDLIKPDDALTLKGLATSAYLTSSELLYLHRKLAEYSGKLALLGFVFSELKIPDPGPTPGVAQAEIPGCYKVEQLADLTAGMVDAGSGRLFLSVAWGGKTPGTIILRKSQNPECWVEVANYLDRKEPEAAVACLLLGHGDPGTPFDPLKKNLEYMERRYWNERSRAAKSTVRGSRE